MGRSRGGRSAPRARSPPPARAQGAPPPAQRQTSSGGGLMSGLMGTVAQGMAFGAGSEVAHQGVRAMMGGSSSGHAAQAAPEAPQQQQADPCAPSMQAFNSCLETNPGDISACQFYLDGLKACREGARFQ